MKYICKYKSIKDLALRLLGVVINHLVERVKGIEPSSKAWEAAVLPLNYTRVRTIVTALPFSSA